MLRFNSSHYIVTLLILVLRFAPCFTQGLRAMPGARTDSISWVDKNGKFWMFGGRGYGNVTTPFNLSGVGEFNDLWCYDPLLDEWSWIGGSFLVNQAGVLGTMGQPSSDNYPGARSTSTSWTSSDGTLWLFGGTGYLNSTESGRGVLNDLWRYNTSSNQWTWMGGSTMLAAPGVYGTLGVPAASNYPGSRYSAATWTTSDEVWLFGGNGIASDGRGSVLNDLWRYTPSTNQWTWIGGNNTIVYGSPAGSDSPGSRQASISWPFSNGLLWLFGGVASQAKNDLWNYNVSANEWTLKNPNLTSAVYYGTQGVPSDYAFPGPRNNGVSWVDSSGFLWMFGGVGQNNNTFSASGGLNDLWRYNLSCTQWTWMGGSYKLNEPGTYGSQGVPSSANIPPSRQSAISWTSSDGSFWLFGGSTIDVTLGYVPLNDLWKYNPASNEWTWVSGSKEKLQYGIYVKPSPPTSGISPVSDQPSGTDTVSSPVATENLAAIVVPSVVVPVVAAGVILGVLLGLKRRKQKKRQQMDNPLSQLSDKRLIPYQSVTLEKEIGSGSFGKVYLGKWQATKVAVKVGNASISTEEFLKEAEFQKGIPPHPNIVQLLGISTDGPHPLVILEYCNNGSLDNLLFDTNQPISTTKKMEIANSIAKGLYHLHENKIVHRDVAARNVLLHNGQPKISDFGMSRILKEASQAGKTTTNIGPIRWMAPESIAHQTYSFKSDVWMFGILIYEITSRQEPHIGEDILDTGVKIRDRGLTPTVGSDCPALLQEIMKMCWNVDPDARPTMGQLCQMLDDYE